MSNVQRWTTPSISPSDAGGFVSYGDYLELERQLAASEEARKKAETGLLKANSQTEEFERKYYLTLDRAEAAEQQLIQEYANHGATQMLMRNVEAELSEVVRERDELRRKLAEQPKWVCFHCGDSFVDETQAREHFGAQQTSEPACKIVGGAVHGILEALRNAEDQLARYYAEDSDTCRAMSKMTVEHARQIRRAEELGYERGLKAHKEELTKLLEEAKRQAVPEGWKLVPIEPNDVMLRHANTAAVAANISIKGRSENPMAIEFIIMRAVYNAMLSAAPQPHKD